MAGQPSKDAVPFAQPLGLLLRKLEDWAQKTQLCPRVDQNDGSLADYHCHSLHLMILNDFDGNMMVRNGFKPI